MIRSFPPMKIAQHLLGIKSFTDRGGHGNEFPRLFRLCLCLIDAIELILVETLEVLRSVDDSDHD